jgi:hypothetical protein
MILLQRHVHQAQLAHAAPLPPGITLATANEERPMTHGWTVTLQDKEGEVVVCVTNQMPNSGGGGGCIDRSMSCVTKQSIDQRHYPIVSRSLDHHRTFRFSTTATT